MKIEEKLQELDYKLMPYMKGIDDKIPVVYCYMNRHTCDVEYIGSTKCNKKRKLQGLNDSKIEFYTYYKTHREDYDFFIIRRCNSRKEAYEYEHMFINVMKPKFNKKCNPSYNDSKRKNSINYNKR